MPGRASPGSSAAFDLAVAEEGFEWGPHPSRPFPALIGNSGGGTPPPPVRSSLPGRGTTSLKRQEEIAKCGSWAPTWKCDEDSEARIAPWPCKLRECSICAGLCLGRDHCSVYLDAHPGGAWSHSEAFAAKARLEDFLEQFRMGRMPMRQVIFSPPPGTFKETDDHHVVILKMRQRAVALVRRFAWRGDGMAHRVVTRQRRKDGSSREIHHRTFGCAVVHLYRGCEQEYDTWGPHVHILCPGIDVPQLDAYRSAELRRGHPVGFVLKQVNGRNDTWASYRGFYLARHLVYELGHAALIEGCPAITWFGGLKNWETPDPAESESEAPLCTRGHQMTLWDRKFWRFDPIQEDDPSFRAYRFDLNDYQDHEVEFTIVRDESDDESWVPPWGDRSACIACMARWRPGGPEVRCPHHVSALDPDDEYDERMKREGGN